MKKYPIALTVLIIGAFVSSCAYAPVDRYNTQRGAAVGAGMGALIGQAIGHNTKGTLIGLTAGTIFGALVGNAADQQYQAARDAARLNKPVIYYDQNGSAVEAIPGDFNTNSNCHKVTKRVWQDGKMISETVEEVCEEFKGNPTPYVVYEDIPPSVYFQYGYYPGPYYNYRHYRPHHHGYWW
jgi:YMGG-like Gly-zipper